MAIHISSSFDAGAIEVISLERPDDIRLNIRKDNASGFRGVCFSRGTGRWKATLSVAGRTLNLGEFTDPESAAKAYDAAALKHRGTFAVLNFPRADGRAA